MGNLGLDLLGRVGTLVDQHREEIGHQGHHDPTASVHRHAVCRHRVIEELREGFEELLAAGRQKNVNAFFVDKKETSFGLSVLEIDRLPELFRNIGFDIKDKVAILINSDASSKPLFDFLQNVFTLSSLRVCVYTNAEEAIAWIKKKS